MVSKHSIIVAIACLSIAIDICNGFRITSPRIFNLKPLTHKSIIASRFTHASLAMSDADVFSERDGGIPEKAQINHDDEDWLIVKNTKDSNTNSNALKLSEVELNNDDPELLDLSDIPADMLRKSKVKGVEKNVYEAVDNHFSNLNVTTLPPMYAIMSKFKEEFRDTDVITNLWQEHNDYCEKFSRVKRSEITNLDEGRCLVVFVIGLNKDDATNTEEEIETFQKGEPYYLRNMIEIRDVIDISYRGNAEEDPDFQAKLTYD